MRRQPRGSSLLRLGAPPSRQANARSCGKRSTPVKLLWNRSLDGAPLRGALLDGAPLRGALLRAVLLGVTFLTASLCGAGTRAAGASAICNSADLMDVVNRPNTAWSPCVV